MLPIAPARVPRPRRLQAHASLGGAAARAAPRRHPTSRSRRRPPPAALTPRPPQMSYDLKGFEAKKASLFKDTETLPSLVCRRR
jgi:hypothetical protein